MATVTMFTDTKNQLLLGTHNMDTNTFRVAFCATANAPVVGNTVLANLTQVAYTNLTGGVAPEVTISETGGIVTGTALTITASASSFGPFQYYAIYNDTAGSKNLVCFCDHGSAVTLAAGETFTIKWNSSATTGTIFSIA